jgi:hypothetical protein
MSDYARRDAELHALGVASLRTSRMSALPA